MQGVQAGVRWEVLEAAVCSLWSPAQFKIQGTPQLPDLKELCAMASPVPLLPVIADVCDTPPPARAAGPSHWVNGLPPVLHSYVEAPSPTGKEQSHGVSPAHLEGCSPLPVGEGSNRITKVPGIPCFHQR